MEKNHFAKQKLILGITTELVQSHSLIIHWTYTDPNEMLTFLRILRAYIVTISWYIAILPVDFHTIACVLALTLYN